MGEGTGCGIDVSSSSLDAGMDREVRRCCEGNIDKERSVVAGPSRYIQYSQRRALNSSKCSLNGRLSHACNETGADAAKSRCSSVSTCVAVSLPMMTE